MQRPMCLVHYKLGIEADVRDTSIGNLQNQINEIFLLCKAAIDVIIDLGDLVRGVNDDRWRLVIRNPREACHDAANTP